MSDPALSACRPLLDERRYRATLVTGDPLELRPGAGVENELSAQWPEPAREGYGQSTAALPGTSDVDFLERAT
jgi:hypothetical protein